MTTTEQTSTKQEILELILKQGEATAQGLADALGVTPQATRRHLKELTAEGLIGEHKIQKGMGRPQNLYRLTRQGRDRLPQSYGEFAVSLLDTLAETGGEEQVKALLRRQWENKAARYRDRLGDGSLRDRLARLVQLRREEGYMAEWHEVKGEEQPIFFLHEHNCAISDIAESYPSVCGNELEMFAAIFPDCHVERTHWLNNGEHRCGYSISQAS